MAEFVFDLNFESVFYMRHVFTIRTIMYIFRERFGKFDVIWDNKSFTAINLDDHKR